MKTEIEDTTLMDIQTAEDMQHVVDQVCLLEIERRRQAAKRDAKIAEIRERYDGDIEAIERNMKAMAARCEKFAKENRAALFAKGEKRAFSAQGIFGFRDGQPTLTLLNRKNTWETVKAALKSLGKWVRTVEEVDKDAIKAAKLSDGELAALGLRIDQKERFYIEPKADEGERVTVPA